MRSAAENGIADAQSATRNQPTPKQLAVSWLRVAECLASRVAMATVQLLQNQIGLHKIHECAKYDLWPLAPSRQPVLFSIL